MSEFLQSHQLMKQKIPEQLEIIDRLPRNEALNKVIKYQLRDRYKNSPIQRQM
jgi:non-ribosomal peptide synthetase component E (peptide arylation enzyme)